MLASLGKDHELFHAVRTEDIQALAKLLAKCRTPKHKLLSTTRKVNVNLQDCDGMSGLHQAALQCSVPVMQVLLDNGAQVDLKDNRGMRPLHYAAWQGKAEPVSLLLQYNASVNEASNSGDTPLHLAAQHGHVQVIKALLCYHSRPVLRNREYKTPLDLACEFGRLKAVQLLVERPQCKPLLEESLQDMADNTRTTCLHLAARNGHVDVIKCLLHAGVDINRATLRGTALHEAAMHGKLEAVRLLIESGIDVNKPNSSEQTALDLVRSFSSSKAARDLKSLLKEMLQAVPARAIRDHTDPSDPDCLVLREGEVVTVLDQSADGRWRGIVFGPGHSSRAGYFPATAVQLLDRPVGGLQRTGTLRASSIKKVAPPVVPELNPRHSASSSSSGYASNNRSSCGSLLPDDYLNAPPSPDYGESCHPGTLFPAPQITTSNRPRSHPGTPVSTPVSPLPPGLPTGRSYFPGPLDDPGIDVGRDSPSSSGSSAESRHSSSSLDSGRGSSTDSKALHRLSVGSSSSLTLSSGSAETPVNVAGLFLHGVSDTEVLTAWLKNQHFEEYIHLFLQAGYDMPTISRMTPEDLTAIGITKPAHRRKLKAEITRLNISDGIPDYKPDSLKTWLKLLRLEQYYSSLYDQGYKTVDKVAELTWEDLEEIGIQKLGHQKKLMLAIKRITDINNGVRRHAGFTETRHTSIDMGQQSRPNSLVSVPVAHYQCQEVAITTCKPLPSPTNDAPQVPEFRTFQQSPPRVSGFIRAGSGELPHHGSSCYPPDFVSVQIRSPNRGRSLESLDDSVPPQHGHADWYDLRSTWCQQGYDTDSELSLHSGYDNIYEYDGTATLHRPRGLVKPRPVAKITAKSRALETELDRDPKIEQDSWSDSSNWTSQVYGTMKGKRAPPPPPPKRTNSIRSSEPPELTVMAETAFATCVQSLTSRFTMATQDDLPPPPDDLPPPPSPLPAQESPMNTLHRKDSAGSSISTDSLPFANENIGTIKQRPGESTPHTSQDTHAPVQEVPSTVPAKVVDKSIPVKPSNHVSSITAEILNSPPPVPSGDVIDDIEHMLANLTNQLDAMLESELTT